MSRIIRQSPDSSSRAFHWAIPELPGPTLHRLLRLPSWPKCRWPGRTSIKVAVLDKYKVVNVPD